MTHFFLVALFPSNGYSRKKYVPRTPTYFCSKVFQVVRTQSSYFVQISISSISHRPETLSLLVNFLWRHLQCSTKFQFWLAHESRLFSSDFQDNQNGKGRLKLLANRFPQRDTWGWESPTLSRNNYVIGEKALALWVVLRIQLMPAEWPINSFSFLFLSSESIAFFPGAIFNFFERTKVV